MIIQTLNFAVGNGVRDTGAPFSERRTYNTCPSLSQTGCYFHTQPSCNQGVKWLTYKRNSQITSNAARSLA